MSTSHQNNASPRRALNIVLAAALSGLMFTVPVTASAEQSKPGIRHSWFMRGQVLSVEGNKGVVCIGKRDNAQVGQILNVVRQTPVTGGSRATGFRPVDVGLVKITGIVDDHYSEVEVIKGEPKVNDTVELERQ